MAKSFCVLIDVCDKALAAKAIEIALSLETSGPLLVFEAHPPLRSLSEGHSFAVAVFDSSRSSFEVKLLCSKKPSSGLPFVSIHVGAEDSSDENAKVMGISKELFEESFLQLLAFCYITHLVRGVISDARKLTE